MIKSVPCSDMIVIIITVITSFPRGGNQSEIIVWFDNQYIFSPFFLLAIMYISIIIATLVHDISFTLYHPRVHHHHHHQHHHHQ